MCQRPEQEVPGPGLHRLQAQGWQLTGGRQKVNCLINYITIDPIGALEV